MISKYYVIREVETGLYWNNMFWFKSIHEAMEFGTLKSVEKEMKIMPSGLVTIEEVWRIK